MSSPQPTKADPQIFPVTRWSLVSRVREGDREERARALSELCEAYWYPVYSYLRKKGEPKAAAEDLTQGFFTMVLRRDDFAKAEAGRGKLRSFLLRALQNFCIDQHEYQTTEKRGGNTTLVSFDAIEAERRYSAEPVSEDPLEAYYERQWALVLLERALNRVKGEQSENHRKTFDALRPLLTGEDGYEEVAKKIQCTPGAARVRVHRLRQRLKLLIKEELRDTVESDEAFEEEFRQFRAAFASLR